MAQESSATPPIDPNIERLKKINQQVAESTKKFDLGLYNEVVKAIAEGDLEVVKAILSAKPALFHVYSEQYKSLFDLAIDKTEIFNWLVENHASATWIILGPIIEAFDRSTDSASSEQSKINHTKIFGRYFLGANVNRIKDDNREKLLGHFKELRGVVTHMRTGKKEELEWFNIEEHLLVNVSGLIELYRKYSKFISSPSDRTAQDALSALKRDTGLAPQEIITKLQDEILLQIEALHNIRITILINSRKDESKKAAKDKFALNLIKKLNAVKDKKEYCFPSGWDNHVLYINFHNLGKVLLVRIDNFGAVSDNLHLKEGSNRYPRVIGSFNTTDLNENNETLKTYLVGLSGAKFIDRSAAEPLIYSKALHTIKVKKQDKDNKEIEEDIDIRKEIDAKYNGLWSALPEQSANNCVIYNDLAAKQYRMGEKLSILVKERLINFVESPVPLLLIGTEMSLPKRKTEEEQLADMSPAAARAALAVRRDTSRVLRRSEGTARSTSLTLRTQVQANMTQEQANQLAHTTSWYEFFKTIPSRIISPCFGYSQAESEEIEMDSRPNL